MSADLGPELKTSVSFNDFWATTEKKLCKIWEKDAALIYILTHGQRLLRTSK